MSRIVRSHALHDGLYRLVLHKQAKSGRIIHSRVAMDWHSNIITNQGLDQVATDISALRYCQIGTGNTAPAAADTELDNWLAGTATIQSGAGASSGATSPYYGGIIRTYRFDAGVGTGNIQEVGVGWGTSGTTLFSRALIVDGMGNPTSITKLSDEILDVSYWHRVYCPTTDTVGTINISGVDYDYTIRPAFAGSTRGGSGRGWGLNSSNIIYNATSNYASASGNASQSGVKAYTGSLGTPLSEPTGSTSVSGFASTAAYVPGSLEREGTYTWGVSDGNLTGGIKSILYSPGWSCYQIEFDNPLPKDNTKQLELTFIHSWSRKTL